MDISIVIAVNKKDAWFCRICVASIRYYYPGVPIYLLKDEMNGRFSTKEIERAFNVNLIEYPRKKFGWSAAKIHFYCDERFKGQKFLVLDSDIVFIGKLLDQAFVKNFVADVIVNEEKVEDPTAKWFTETYFDYQKIKALDGNYSFPGYTFNCGQLFCKGNFITRNTLKDFFDFENLPSWKRLDVFPLVDQSLFNYLLPVMEGKGEIAVERKNFMLWSELETTKEISLKDILSGDQYPLLIHWAGAVRTPVLNKMTQEAILFFFEKKYYSKIPGGSILRYSRKLQPLLISNLRSIYRNIKQVYKPRHRKML